MQRFGHGILREVVMSLLTMVGNFSRNWQRSSMKVARSHESGAAPRRVVDVWLAATHSLFAKQTLTPTHLG